MSAHHDHDTDLRMPRIDTTKKLGVSAILGDRPEEFKSTCTGHVHLDNIDDS